jgi:hypothetical protein
MRLRVPSCARLVPLLLVPVLLQAQPVRGVGDDALTAPRGSIRVQVSTSISDFSRRYGKGTPGRADGNVEPLGIDFSSDSLGATQFPGLGPVESAIRTLTGNSAFRLSLGRSNLVSSVRRQVTPIALEAGLTNWLSLGVVVPIVSVRNQVSLNINGDTTVGTVSFNPARGDSAAANANALLVSQITAARTQLQALLTGCTSNPASNPSCASILASAPTITASATAFSSGIATIYGTTTSNGAAFVPLAGSAADSAIRNRVQTLRTQFESFGITALPATSTGPARPSAVVTPDGLRRYVSDSAFGLNAASIGTITRQGIGDVEVAVKLRLFDTFGTRRDTMRFQPRGLNIRQSIAGVYRLGTSTVDSPDDYMDYGTGDGQNDIELRSFTDLVYGKRFFGSIVARYTLQQPDQQILRITDTPDQVFPAAYRRRLVDRDLGDQLELEITPRWVLNDHFSFGVQYLFRRRGEDRYTGTFTVPTTESGLPAALELDARTLALETSGTEQRLGFGITFSSLAAHARGKARLPVEIQYLNTHTIAGSGGAVPQLSIHQVQIRYYPRR